MSTTAASERSLVPAGGTQTLQFGPGLTTDMGPDATVAALNAWGSARDRELVQLRADLEATQTIVASTFEQAKSTLQGMVDNFRAETASLRYDTQVEAAQSLSRLQAVVGEARARFDAQDALVAGGLGELAQRLQAAGACEGCGAR
jgi:hypothetical protein